MGSNRCNFHDTCDTPRLEMMVYTKFCQTCKSILVIDEMGGSICDKCRSEQIKEMKRHAETLKDRLEQLAKED